MHVDFEPATPGLIQAWYGGPAPWTLRGMVGISDGRPVGIFGIYWIADCPVGFSEWLPEVDNKSKARGFRLAEAMLDAHPTAVFAVPNPNQPTAPAILARLGFVPTGDEIMGGPLLVREPRHEG